MLRRQCGTLSLMKSGHPTPSHPSNHHLKLIFFSSPTDGGGGEREREGGRERERTGGLSWNVRVFLFVCFFTYFVSCNGPYALKEKWHRKEHISTIIIKFKISGTQDAKCLKLDAQWFSCGQWHRSHITFSSSKFYIPSLFHVCLAEQILSGWSEGRVTRLPCHVYHTSVGQK